MASNFAAGLMGLAQGLPAGLKFGADLAQNQRAADQRQQQLNLQQNMYLDILKAQEDWKAGQEENANELASRAGWNSGSSVTHFNPDGTPMNREQALRQSQEAMLGRPVQTSQVGGAGDMQPVEQPPPSAPPAGPQTPPPVSSMGTQQLTLGGLGGIGRFGGFGKFGVPKVDMNLVDQIIERAKLSGAIGLDFADTNSGLNFKLKLGQPATPTTGGK